MTITLQNQTGGRACRGPSADEVALSLVGTPTETIISGSSSSQETTRDTVFDVYTGATFDTVAQMQAAVAGLARNQPVVMESLDPSIGTLDASGRIFRQSDGHLRIKASTIGNYPASVTERVRVFRNVGSVSHQFASFAPGSVARAIYDTLWSRLIGHDPVTEWQMIELFSVYNPAANAFAYNEACWALDFNLAPIAAWYPVYNNGKQAGTLISPRHYVAAWHFKHEPGYQIKYVDYANVVHTRTIVDRVHLGADMELGVLNADLPESVGFCKVLPSDWQDYLGPSVSSDVANFAQTFGPPALAVNQMRRCYAVQRLHYLGTSQVGYYPNLIQPPDGFIYGTQIGDSGSAMGYLLEGELILVNIIGGTPLLPASYGDVNAAMTDLGGGYQLTEADFSAYTNFGS